MADLTRDDLTRLRDLIAKWDAAIEHGSSIDIAEAFGAATEAVMDHADALLALATEAFDRREAAREIAARYCHGCAKDPESREHGHSDTCPAREILTAFGLDAGPASVRAHDKARRGGK